MRKKLKTFLSLSPQTIRTQASRTPILFYLYFSLPLLPTIISWHFMPNLAPKIVICIALTYALYIHFLQQYELATQKRRLPQFATFTLYYLNTIFFPTLITLTLCRTLISDKNYAHAYYVPIASLLLALEVAFLMLSITFPNVLRLLFFLIVPPILFTLLCIVLIPLIISIASFLILHLHIIDNPNLLATLETFSASPSNALSYILTSPNIAKTDLFAILTTVIGVISGFIIYILRKPLTVLDSEDEKISSFIEETQQHFTAFIKSCINGSSKKDMQKLKDYCDAKFSYVKSHSSENFSDTWHRLIWLLERAIMTFPENSDKDKKPLYLQILPPIMTLDNYFHIFWQKPELYRGLFVPPSLNTNSLLFVTQIIGKKQLLSDMNIRKETRCQPQPTLADINNEFQKINKESTKQYCKEFSFT